MGIEPIAIDLDRSAGQALDQGRRQTHEPA
jgi:hypothetical protein